ncbi:MAG: rhomboid family intramembrane serine protease [Bacteroidales bacterium]
MKTHERTRMLSSMLYPAMIVAIMWIVKLAELIFQTRVSFLGVKPMHAEGLVGILTSPFVHGDLAHLTANTFPMLVLGSVLFYVYRPIAWKVFLFTWLVTGIWVWFWGRESWHIGASGVVYGLASFLFFSGIFRRDGRLLAITFLVAFLYGSMVWGVFPDLFPEKNISWESHLMGLIAGLVFALFFRDEGPQRKKYSWEYEDEDDLPAEDDPDAYWNRPLRKRKLREPMQINYVYKENNKNPDDKSDQTNKKETTQ